MRVAELREQISARAARSVTVVDVPDLAPIEALADAPVWRLSSIAPDAFVVGISLETAAILAEPSQRREQIEALLRGRPALRGLILFVYGLTGEVAGFIEVCRDGEAISWSLPLGPLGPLFP